MQDRNTQPCPCCSSSQIVMKPLYKVFHSQQFQPLLPRKPPTSCQSRFIQANLLPTYLLCPLHNSDTLPLCPAPSRQLCPLSAFSVPFWASNVLLWEVLRYETHQLLGHLSWPSPSLLTWIQSVLDKGNPRRSLTNPGTNFIPSTMS